jgi:ABC-type nitrate/sulfonate/bicarbonate transport system substrate-binding protein
VLEGAMLSGQVPITYQASPAVIQADLAGLDIAMFAGVINTTFFSILARPEITRAEDLRGKVIGDSGPGSNDRAAGQYGLARFGLDLGTDVTPITIQGGQTAQLAALSQGGVDAAVLAPPSTYVAEKQGFTKLLDLGTLGLEYQSGTLSASRRFIAANRDTVLRFTRALSEGIYFYKTDKAASIAAIGSYTGEKDPDILERSYDDFALAYSVKVPRPTLNGIQFVIDHVVPDPAAKQHSPEEFVDLSFVDQLEAEGLYRQLWGNNTSGV